MVTCHQYFIISYPLHPSIKNIMQTKIAVRLALIIFILTLILCKEAEPEAYINPNTPSATNLLSGLSSNDTGELNWMNRPTTFTFEKGSLNAVALKGTDFFNNPEDSTITGTAPFLYKSAQGDFVARALVKPDMTSMWNAVALMVYIDDRHWIKFAFENSDATGPSIVTVITKDVSDDANGAVLSGQEEVWLKLVRKNNSYSMLWSMDGKNYKMARLGTLPATDAVKIGIEVQCPVGEAASHEITYFGIENRTVEDLRKGE